MVKVELLQDSKVRRKEFKKGSKLDVSFPVFIDLAKKKAISIPKNAKKVLPANVYEHLVSEKIIKD